MLCRQEVARRQCGTHLGTSGYLQATHECLHACTSIIREHLATFTSGLAVPPWSEKSDQVSTYTGGRSLQGRVRPPSRRRLRCGSAAENTGSQPANQQLLPNNHGKLLAAARHGQRGRTQAAGPGKEGRTGARANRGSVPRTRVATGPADGFIPRRRAPAGSAASAGMACIGVSFVGDRAPVFRPVAPPTPLPLDLDSSRVGRLLWTTGARRRGELDVLGVRAGPDNRRRRRRGGEPGSDHVTYTLSGNACMQRAHSLSRGRTAYNANALVVWYKRPFHTGSAIMS